MACIYTEHDTAPVVEIRITGKVTQHDMDMILPKLEAFIERHGAIRLVEIVDWFEGFEPSTLIDGIRFDVKNLRHVTHAAVVSDLGWVGMVTRAASLVMPLTLRMFKKDELDAARDWALNAPKEETESAA